MNMKGRNGIHLSSAALAMLLIAVIVMASTPQAAVSQEQTCENTTYSLFTDSSDARTVEFPDGGGSDASSKMDLPIGADVVLARAHLAGDYKNFSSDRPLDIALVNDASGSMDDNCHCADGTPSNNGVCSPAQGMPYHPDLPCKIEDMKNASKMFAEDVLGVPGNKLGTVRYSTSVASFLPLGDNITAIRNRIDTYSASGFTCISCGINKGIEILSSGLNEEQVIVLMSDGIANQCIPGVDCDDAIARQEALDEAQRAWDDYNISIIAIGFGGDAQEDLLQEIANISANAGGLGHYHFVNETDIEHLYEEIAGEITSVYPENPSLDVGSNTVIEWSFAGPFSTEDDAADYSSALEGLLSDCSCAGCQDIGGGVCRVDFELTSDTAGFIAINTTVVTKTCAECEVDDDCDELDDQCNDGVCDAGQCVAQPKALSTPCEADGEFCTVDHCDGEGSCAYYYDYDCSDSVSCTADSCNDVSDQCVHTPNDGSCQDGLFCDGVEWCHPDNGCQPGTPVDCSPYSFPEISQCNNNPDGNPYTWDYAAGFISTCDEGADSCTQSSYSFTHECRDDDEFDGLDSDTCGAECDQDADCSCPQDACYGDDWYDFPDESFCDSCFCTSCEPVITPQHESCVKVCERDGEFGQGHEYLCHGDGTYDRCREDGSGYDYENICMEECTAAPQCDGFPPMYHFQACDWTGQHYLQDYCDIQCQIRDNHCESSFAGCTSDPQCDEVIPGTDSCTYQCEYKPEICYTDGEWGDEPHQYVCLEDNTYNECIESGPGYGTHYEHVNECSYLCSGDIECDGLAPGSELSSCDIFGLDYLQDYCDMSCRVQDDNCESDYSGCTSDSGCDEAAPGTDLYDQCFTCQFQFCGDGFINPFEPFDEECDPEAQDSAQCGQTTEECEPGTARLGVRDDFGDCDGCVCDPDAFEYGCIEGECGALCDENEDCGNFCTGDVLSYSGTCDLLQYCDCSYNTKDCNDYDDDYFVDFHCDSQTGDIWNWYEDWMCAEDGIADCAYSGFDYKFDVHEDCEDTCLDTDGGIEFGIQGSVTDEELCDQEGQTTCPEQTFDDFCSVEGEVLTEYYCDGDDAAWTTLDCDSLDYYDEYAYYCDGDDVRRNRDFHDFSCSPGGCTEQVSTVDDELVEECNDQDDWYNYGNDQGLDDPECEFRDYTCVEDGQASCGYGVTESHDYDDQDGSYCADGDEAVEDRDYYCDSSGSAQHTASEPQDCGPEAWSGGGNTPGFGDDPACVYTDYFCVDDGVSDHCDSSQPYSDDYDPLDTASECYGTNLEGDHDFWCEVGLCDSNDPSNLCDYGDDFLNLRCSQFCGAQCDEDGDCPDNSCEETYDDFCVGMKLSEYDSDHVQDSTTVDDECGNTCDTIESCACSDCATDCSPPQVSSYCVEGQCGAECDDSGDCPPWLDVPNRECNYDIDCGNDCGCGPGSQEFCPPPGTVEQGTCYYGVRDCVDIEGCTIDTCVLELGEYCDPMEGCTEVPCPDIDPITLFSDATGEKVIEYPSGGGSDDSAKVSVPTDLVVYTATVNLTGLPVSFTEDRILDFVLVNDASGSMDDNCHCADGTPSANGLCLPEHGYPYHPDLPCKIEDMKNASKVFAGKVLSVSGNMLGTVRYSTKLRSFLPLTNNLTAIENRIDMYEAEGQTCISCGIRKGIDVVSAGSNTRVMILMTDGLANFCFGGVNCDDAIARQEAISEAQRAWDDYGISIITVGFGDDVDPALLGTIANVSGNDGGLGQYFFAPADQDLEFLYDELATLLTKVSPTNPSLDTGADGGTEWSYAGEFQTSETADFASELQSLLGCACPGCSLAGDECVIDLELASDTAGIIIANNLMITGCIPEPPNGGVIACSSCQECGGGQDCEEEAPWSQWDCAYDSPCDESGDCSRSRTVTTYSCANPGTTSSYCQSSQSPDEDNEVQLRDTSGTPCDDGLFCTVGETCGGGVCEPGSPRDCDDLDPETEDSCDEDADQCVHDPIVHNSTGDMDEDGVPDSEDACPSEYGDYCNGCPEPACTGCAVPDCPSEGAPTCAADDVQCSPVACPADGCELETCSIGELTDYADFAAATCQVDGLDGTCEAQECAFTCTLDQQCGWNPSCTPATHILISEVLYNAVNESGAEWIELYNPVASPVDISGWKLSDGEDTYVFPEGTVINASDYLSVTNDAYAFHEEFGCYADLEGLGLALANTKDELVNLNDNDNLIDHVTWGGDGNWDISAGEGLSIRRSPSYCDTNSADDWLSGQTPTLTCSLFQQPDYCIEITGLRVLNDTLDEASVIEPGTMYHIEITNHNSCGEDTDVLTIAQVRENGDIAQGSVSYTILDGDDAVVTIGFLLPEDVSPGTDIFADVYNWNHWMFVNPGTWEALSEDGLAQFQAG